MHPDTSFASIMLVGLILALGVVVLFVRAIEWVF